MASMRAKQTYIYLEKCIKLGYYERQRGDYSNGMRKGQSLNLTGKSVFEFEGNKIVKLTDISWNLFGCLTIFVASDNVGIWFIKCVA